jgi:hypothetical protein
MYETNEIVKELNQFKVDALIRLNTLELKVIELKGSDEDIKNDIEELKQSIAKETDLLHDKIEYVQKEMPSGSTNKIMFAIFGATLSFLFSMILLGIR